MRRFFWFLNKYFMVPMFRLGFGPFFGNPITGYIMVLKVIGRKTGKLRYAPVNYAIMDGTSTCASILASKPFCLEGRLRGRQLKSLIQPSEPLSSEKSSRMPASPVSWKATTPTVSATRN
jgi:hypothetical protein